MNRSELRTLFKSLIDDNQDNVFDAARINILLYEGALAIQQELELRDAGYFVESTNLEIAATDTSAELPGNCNKVIKLTDVTDDPVDYIYCAPQELTRYSQMDRYFTIRDSSIIFSKALDRAHTIRLDYSLLLSDLADDASWSAIPTAFHRFIAAKAAMIALAAEGSEVSDLAAIYESQLQKALDNITPRQNNTPRHVRITDAY